MPIALLLITFLQGLAAGVCFDVATVKLPTRKRIGAVAYAEFARSNDLHYRLRIYPALVVGGAALLLAFTIAAYGTDQSLALRTPLLVASLCALGALAATAKAAPIMWSLRKTQDEEPALARKLDRFAFWHGWRTASQLGAFAALLWALA